MRSLLVVVLCSIPLIATTVYAQGSTPSPLGSTAGDARGPGKSNANIGGASGAEVMNKLNNGEKHKKDTKHTDGKTTDLSKEHKDSYRKKSSESPESDKERDATASSVIESSHLKTPKH